LIQSTHQPVTKRGRPVDWRSLLAYVRALNDFTRQAPARLCARTFARINATSAISDPPVQESEARDGCRLAYRAYAAAESRHVIVLIHGSAGYGDQMGTIARRLAAANVASAYTIDMRGHGLSDGRAGHAVKHPWQLIDDLGDFLAQVRDQHPGASLCLAGHSAGGGLALGLSRCEADSLVDSYLFLAPFLGLGCPANRPYFGGWVSLRALKLRALTLANLFGIERFNDATVVDFDIREASDARYAANWSYNTMLAFGPGRWLPDAPPIPADKPVLVLAGDEDDCFDPALYPAAFATVAPHAGIRSAGPIGHWDLLVSEHAITQIARWLADIAVAELVDTAEANPPRRRPAQKKLKEAS
jgi:alpha-beta hydrolase superfamily lysophospholipase